MNLSIEEALKYKPRSRSRYPNAILYDYKGEKYTLRELSELTGIKYFTLQNRVRRDGLSIEEAIEKPIRKRRKVNRNE